MKKIVLPIIGLLIATGGAFAQKIIDEKIACEETRLPMEPLGETISAYDFTIKTPYPENNDDVEAFAKQKYEEDLANFPAKVEEAKRMYEEALANYDYDVEQARENFRIESEEYNKLSKLERLALADQKPTLRLPRKPYYSEPREPVYRKPDVSGTIVFPAMILQDMVKLEGYDKGTENAVTGTIELYGFENQDPERKFEEKKVYNSKTKQSTVQKVYYYMTSYKRPASVEISTSGQALMSGMYEPSQEYTEIRTKNRPNLLNLEKQSVEDVLLSINDYINDLYGYSKITREFEIKSVKNKSGDYDDLENAMLYAKEGLMKLELGQENEALDQAITTWETALAEANMEDKKARINEKVAEAILFNLLNVHLANYDIAKSEECIAKLKDLSLNYSEKTELKSLEDLYLDRKIRAENNGM